MTYLDVSHYEGIKVPIEMTSLTLVQNLCGTWHKAFSGTLRTYLMLRRLSRTDILMPRPFLGRTAAAENVRTPKTTLKGTITENRKPPTMMLIAAAS